MHEARRFRREDDAEPSILDVNDLPLDVVLASDDSALSTALRRVVRDMDQPGENFAAHGSTP